MKFLLTFVCAAIFVASINATVEIPAAVKAEWDEMTKLCLAEVPNLNKENYVKATKGEYIEDDEDLKKLIFCIQKKANAFKEDGSINVDILKASASKIYGNHDSDKLIDECVQMDQHDAAKSSWPLFKCLNSKLPKIDFPL